MRALSRSMLVAGLCAPVALSMAPLAFAGDMSSDGHHASQSEHKDDHGKKDKKSDPACAAPSGGHGKPATGADLLAPAAPLLGIISTTTGADQTLDQTLTQDQSNSTDQSNSLVAPVVQVNPSILSAEPVDNSVAIDNAQGNANKTAQGQMACQVGVGGDQS
jgi:hypothetical protein